MDIRKISTKLTVKYNMCEYHYDLGCVMFINTSELLNNTFLRNIHDFIVICP